MATTTPTTSSATGTAISPSNVTRLPAKAATRPSDKVIAFVKRHPVVVVAGGLAVGAAVSALLPRRTTRRWFSRAVDLAEATGATALLFGREAGEKAQSLGAGAGKKASLFATRVEKAGDVAAEKLEKYGMAAIAAASSLGRTTARKAGELGETAAAQSGRALHKVQDTASGLRERIRH
jgi:hypothetical protein